MIKALINGANGKMGGKVRNAAIESGILSPVCGADIKENFSDASFPVYKSLTEVKEKVDVLIDFSSPSSLNGILNYITTNKIPAVLCSTGYSQEDIAKINEASKTVAIFRSANMSLGVNVLLTAVKAAAATLGDFDVEIIEKHHNNKVDAPSGTALMLADAIKEVFPEKFYVYGRNGFVGKRDKNEIGIHAIRGGNIVGEHEVIFAGENETLTFSHLATDRGVFAIGAVKAAIFIADKKCGLFNMADVICK